MDEESGTESAVEGDEEENPKKNKDPKDPPNPDEEARSKAQNMVVNIGSVSGAPTYLMLDYDHCQHSVMASIMVIVSTA